MNENAPVPKAVWIVSIAVLTFLMFPIFVVVPISFSSATYLEFPPKSFSLRWYVKYFSDPEWINATFTSFQVALLTMISSTILGAMAAFALVRGRFIGKSIVYAILLSPMIVPLVVSGIAMYFLFSNLNLVDTATGLVIAHTVIALPFAMLTMTTSIDNLDSRLEQAASGLGANRFYAMRRVVFPILLPGIVITAILSFLTSFDEVVVAIFLANTDTVTVPKKMWSGISLEITPTIAAASTILIAITVIVFICIDRLQQANTSTGAK
jgi:ABC-type spermidine/putrescine transport system permease subunit II